MNGSKKSQEEIDFERAIALSLAESKSSAPSDPYAQPSSLPGVGYGYEAKPSKPTPASQPAAAMPSKQLEEEDPDLAAAIRASLAEAQPQASTSAAASAPPKSSYVYAPAVQPSAPSYELAMSEFDALDSFSNALRDPHIRPEDANELFTRADRHRGKMYRALEDAHAKSSMLSELNQKLQHAVRLYDSLLERNISRYNQPYQQSAPQQYYQNPQPQPQYQPYQAGPQYQTQQPYQPAPSQSRVLSPQQQQQYAPVAPTVQPQSSYEAQENRNYAPPGPAQYEHSYQHQDHQPYSIQDPHSYEQPQAGEPQRQPQDVAYTAEQAPMSPAQQHDMSVYAAGQAQPPSANVDEQYYNPYPAEIHEQPISYQSPNGYPQQNFEQQPVQYHDPQEQQNGQDQQYVSSQGLDGASHHATTVKHGTQANPVEGASQPPSTNMPNGRFQGFYSAASFPAVPSMPVGGLPTAPKGELAEQDSARQQEESRKEEALIEF